jgi:hypothetical protein
MTAYPRGVERDPHPGPAPGDEPDADELAWRAIVDNYGERAQLDEPELRDGPEAAAPASGPETLGAPFGGRFGDLSSAAPAPDAAAAGEEDEERFVPPEPPPLPRVAPDRLLAWVGVLGSPLVLLACLLLSVGMPSLLAYALVASFVGGFGYLVWTMPRGPRDPWDDGAQV